MFETMTPRRPRHRGHQVLAATAAIAAFGLLGAGCSSTKGASTSSPSASSASSSSMPAGMNMGPAPSVNGVKAVPSQVLATADWQGMKIVARTMSAAPFMTYNGTGWTEVKPTAKTSFHLMVMLNDAHTGVPIPYAGVWATVSLAGKVVYDERQWPMLSAFMGPHYGNNVSLPGAGHYQLSLLISPPVAARHLEYRYIWLKPHNGDSRFNWKPSA